MDFIPPASTVASVYISQSLNPLKTGKTRVEQKSQTPNEEPICLMHEVLLFSQLTQRWEKQWG